MKGKKPALDNVVPMKGDSYRPTPPAPEWFPHPEAVEAWEHLAPVLIAKNRLEPPTTKISSRPIASRSGTLSVSAVSWRSWGITTR